METTRDIKQNKRDSFYYIVKKQTCNSNQEPFRFQNIMDIQDLASLLPFRYNVIIDGNISNNG